MKILDHISLKIYIIDKYTHKLLYANKSARIYLKQHNNKNQEDFCYHLINQYIDLPTHDAAQESMHFYSFMKENISVTVQTVHTPKFKDAVMLTIEDSADIAIQQNSSKCETSSFSLQPLYDLIYKLDLNSGRYELVTCKKINMLPVKGFYSEIVRILQPLLHKNDSNTFLSFFSDDHLRKLTSDSSPASYECRVRNSTGSYQWIRAELISEKTDSNTELSILLYLRDITAEKLQEEKKTARQKRLMSVLTQEYERAYDIDTITKQYSLTYLNDTNYTAPLFGDYTINFTAVLNTHVDKPFRKQFYQRFAFDTLITTLQNETDCISLDYKGAADVNRHSWKNISAYLCKNQESGHKNILLIIKDISKQKTQTISACKQALLKKELEYNRLLSVKDEKFSTVIKQTGTHVFEWTKEEGYCYISETIRNTFHINQDSDSLLRTLIHPEDMPVYEAHIKKLLSEYCNIEFSVRLRHSSGHYIWGKIAINAFFDESRTIIKMIGTIQDIDKQTKAYIDLKYKATHDALTGLANKEKFYSSVEKRIKRNQKNKYAVIVFDLDKFRVINDLYGTDTGDDALRFIGRILRAKTPKNCCSCRLYADTFGIFIDYKNDDDITSFINDIILQIQMYDCDIKLVVSYGVYRVDPDASSASQMCDWASFAKRSIKGNMLKNGAFYDETMRNSILEDKAIESEMEYALETNQFQIYLQPKMNMCTTSVIGAEALVRWIHPIKGMLPPNRFIPLFEQNNFIIKLDIFVWEQVCKLLRQWIDAGKSVNPISVNVSRLHILNSNLEQTLLSLTEKYNIPHHLLELEITETAFFDDMESLQACIYNLKSHGFLISMDDFGTGYSSLNMLKEVPVDILKIDREFLKEVVSTKRGQTVIRHTIAMANDLDLDIIIEGVETKEQAAFLIETGCTKAQGYYYSSPLSVDKYELFAFHSDKETA